MLSRRAFLSVLLSGTVLVALKLSPKRQPTYWLPKKPAPAPTNIIIVVADDLGWGETSYNGHRYVRTPTLDDMAAKGLCFERFYAASPLCNPSRVSITTGRNSARARVFSNYWQMHSQEITFAEVLKNAGYATGHFGKWHMGHVHKGSLTPNAKGFEESLASENFFDFDPVFSRNGEYPQQYKGEGSRVVTDATIEFIKSCKQRNQPFVAFLCFGSPHTPYVATPNQLKKTKAVPDNPELTARYAEIEAMDNNLGRLRTALRTLEMADNTVLWFTSDNGTPAASAPFNGGLRGEKNSLWEGGLRVPTIVEWPAHITQHISYAAPCVGTDILPTLLELAGTHMPDARPLDGVSLAALLHGDAAMPRTRPIGVLLPTRSKRKSSFTADPIPARFYRGMAWMSGSYKMIVSPRHLKEYIELYNITEDPLEQQNIAAAHPALIEQMRKELDTWLQSINHSLTGADYT